MAAKGVGGGNQFPASPETVKDASPKAVSFPLLAGVAVVILAVAAGWGSWSLLSAAHERAQALNERQTRPGLSEVLARPEGTAAALREARELNQACAQLQQNEDQLAASWAQAYKEARGAGQDWATDPGKWKDRMIQLRSEVFRRSRDAVADQRILFSPDFSLGLEAFQQKSPGASQMAEVTRDLSVAYRLVTLLQEAKTSTVEGYPTPCKLVSLRVPSGAKGKGEEEAASPSPSGRAAPRQVSSVPSPLDSPMRWSWNPPPSFYLSISPGWPETPGFLS